jgi:hypothetical protein
MGEETNSETPYTSKYIFDNRQNATIYVIMTGIHGSFKCLLK